MIENLGLCALIYALVCMCVLFPPQEFLAAGLSVHQLFGKWLGREDMHFVQYHRYRVCLNTIAHSCLPAGFVLFLALFEDSFNLTMLIDDSIWWPIRLMINATLLLPILVSTLVYTWTWNNWQTHPIVKSLRAYDVDWVRVATSIDDEYRRVDKFAITLGGINRVIVTDSWVLHVSTYDVCLSQQQDVSLTLVAANQHSISHHSDNDVQFLDILVQNTQKHTIKPFHLRLNAVNYADLQGKLQQAVSVASDVMLQQSTDGLFVDAFSSHVQGNPKVHLDENAAQNVDLCLGCNLVQANVKLEKHCLDTETVRPGPNGQPLPACRPCYCRPMWCVSCMARWFSSRQDQHQPEHWLEGKSPCPTCRATFCMLDVCMTEQTG